MRVISTRTCCRVMNFFVFLPRATRNWRRSSAVTDLSRSPEREITLSVKSLNCKKSSAHLAEQALPAPLTVLHYCESTHRHSCRPGVDRGRSNRRTPSRTCCRRGDVVHPRRGAAVRRSERWRTPCPRIRGHEKRPLAPSPA